MRIVGKRTDRPLCENASGEALREAAAFNEMLQNAFPFGTLGYIPKGVYKFARPEQANQQEASCIAQHMAKIEMQMNR
jgi:hypothetical protein